MTPPLRIVFMGTAPLSCASLAALVDHPAFAVAAVVTQPDKPSGRHLQLTPSPVKELALARQLRVLQPKLARDENFLAELRQIAPDLIVVVAYGQILPQPILDLPRHGCLNLHTSLLPKHRGAAPIQWAILNDDPDTGVTIMKMDAGLDTGPVVALAATSILPEDDSQTLHDRLAKLGAELLVRTIPGYVSGALQPRPQPAEGASYARKIAKQDGLLDWRLPARTLWNRVRAFTPWPGAFTFLPAGGRTMLLKIWQASIVDASGAPATVLQSDRTGFIIACGRQALSLSVVQLEGGRRQTVQEFFAGHKLPPGTRLENLPAAAPMEGEHPS